MSKKNLAGGGHILDAFLKEVETRCLDYSMKRVTLAKLIDVDVKEVSMWFGRQKLPTYEQVNMMAEIFRIDPSDMFGCELNSEEYEYIIGRLVYEETRERCRDMNTGGLNFAKMAIDDEIKSRQVQMDEISLFDLDEQEDRPSVTEFGKEIKRRLVDLDRNQKWLIDRVRENTGLYFDSSYMYKIMVGTLATPKIVGAIREILGIEEVAKDER